MNPDLKTARQRLKAAAAAMTDATAKFDDAQRAVDAARSELRDAENAVDRLLPLKSSERTLLQHYAVAADVFPDPYTRSGPSKKHTVAVRMRRMGYLERSQRPGHYTITQLGLEKLSEGTPKP